MIDHVVVDPRQGIGEVGFGIKPVQLCRLDERQSIGQPFATGIRSGEQEVLAADGDGTHGSLGRIVVDPDAAIVEEQRESVPSIEAIADGLGQVALARDLSEPLLGPAFEGVDQRPGFVLAHSLANIGGLAREGPLDIVEGADLVECLLGDLRLRSFPDIVEIAPEMGPAGGFPDLSDAGYEVRLVKLAEAGIGSGLQDAGKARQMGLGMNALAIGREEVGRRRRVVAGKGRVVADIDLDAAFLDGAPASP